MVILHLKKQVRTFTLASGKSLYLYPLAKAEISEQDFYLSKKFQKYAKEQGTIRILEKDDQKKSSVSKKYSGQKQSNNKNKRKGKKFKSKKSSYVVEE